MRSGDPVLANSALKRTEIYGIMLICENATYTGDMMRLPQRKEETDEQSR